MTAVAVVSTQNAAHYLWGGVCDGWHLLRDDRLSVIQERMPPGASETRHLHRNAQQFFYILSGCARMSVSQREFVLQAGQGLHVAAGIAHRIENLSDHDVVFLVISSPASHGDREEIAQT